jgi:hypothetical protein
MSEQVPDLPRSVQIIGQYRILVAFMAALGFLGGIVFGALNPPGSASKALVVFAAPPCPGGGGAICGGPMFSPAYIQARLLKTFPSGVQIEPVAGNVLSVSVVAGTRAQAEATAEAAARSFVADAGSLSYLGEQPSAKIIQPATTATGTTTPKQLLGDALLGGVIGALVGIIAALAGGQTIIDPVTLPRGLGLGGEDGQAGRETGYYPSTWLSLEQMALEYRSSESSMARQET